MIFVSSGKAILLCTVASAAAFERNIIAGQYGQPFIFAHTTSPSFIVLAFAADAFATAMCFAGDVGGRVAAGILKAGQRAKGTRTLTLHCILSVTDPGGGVVKVAASTVGGLF